MVLLIENHGDPEPLPRIGKCESLRHHAYNCVIFLIYANRLTQNGTIRSVPALPQSIAEHHHVFPPRRFLVWKESAAHRGFHPQDIEKSSGCAKSLDDLGFCFPERL